jgi:hypothetical protein
MAYRSAVSVFVRYTVSRAIATTLFVTGCTDSSGPDDATQSIQTGALSYTLEVLPSSLRVTVDATYRNETNGCVLLPRCVADVPVFTLEKRVEAEWRVAFTPACNLGGLPPFTVESGGSRTDAFPIEGSTVPNTEPHFEIEPVPGTYRLVYDIRAPATEPGRPGELLPKALRVSNAFDIVE